jgi:hypothetical protein
MSTQSIAVTVLIETDDPRLDLTRISVATAAQAAALRRAVIENLPKLTRVVSVMSEQEARLMHYAHRLVAQAADVEIMHPPKDYVPPTRG